MKKFIILIVLIAVGFIAYFYTRDTEVKVETDTPAKTTSFKPDASNATFTFDDESVKLSNGKNTSADGEDTTILPEKASGDINADGKEDTVLLISRSGSGSGVFIYAAAYVSGPVNYKGTNTIFLGDRIAPKSVSITNGVITVNYLDRALDEPFAAEPTISTSLELVYKNGELQEK